VAKQPLLKLDGFLPYRISVLANTISTTLASAYSRQFDLRIPEWRVLATLGGYPDSSAREVAQRTAMDKVAVSRAVSNLMDQGRVSSAIDSGDRRRTLLRLSADGEALLARIVPLAHAYESRLLETLSVEERVQFESLLHKLMQQASLLSNQTVE
jgi:DNA-binding MarR family transcriptional regulator